MDRNEDIVVRLRVEVGAPYPLMNKAADEIERIRGVGTELTPYLTRDVDFGLGLGPGDSCEVEDCLDCEDYSKALEWQRRIDSGELRFNQ